MKNWQIAPNGKKITSSIEVGERDFLEMSGRGASYIVTYGRHTDGVLELIMHPIFPRLRTRPNDTHATFQCDVRTEDRPRLLCNGSAVKEIGASAAYDGVLTVTAVANSLHIEHQLYPAVSGLKAVFDRVTIRNSGEEPVYLELDPATRIVGKAYGVMGIVLTECRALADLYDCLLAPGDAYVYTIVVSGRKTNETPVDADPETELAGRWQDVARLTQTARLDTGTPLLDTMFYFAKLRAGDSVYDTASGLLHSPGGQSYHAAIWCNDQCEYAGPWHGMTGDPLLCEAAMNAYRLYEPFMGEDFDKLPSSIIAEGFDIWDGAGDRGDAAMYLYGGAAFALTCGNAAYRRQLWKNLLWCAEYCHRKRNPFGVVASDSDELEGRFPAGDANLSTSSLYYGGLIYTARLAADLGEFEAERELMRRAEALRRAVNDYFRAELHGYQTYKYYAECDKLRSWICLPLCVGIDERAAGTVEALLSPYLTADCGLVTAEGDTVLWDRSTLYAIKGIIRSGGVDRVWSMFMNYCRKRLIGDHVPYAVEAYPEGNGTHLSGESALFCRIVTEALLEIEPLSSATFAVIPHLPQEISCARLENVCAFGGAFDILVENARVSVTGRDGTTIQANTVGDRTVYTVCRT